MHQGKFKSKWNTEKQKLRVTWLPWQFIKIALLRLPKYDHFSLQVLYNPLSVLSLLLYFAQSSGKFYILVF